MSEIIKKAFENIPENSKERIKEITNVVELEQYKADLIKWLKAQIEAPTPSTQFEPINHLIPIEVLEKTINATFQAVINHIKHETN